MCGFFRFFWGFLKFLFKVEQLLLHETRHLTVKTGAPMLISADVSLQNRCIGFGEKHLAFKIEQKNFVSKFFIKSRVTHNIFISF